MKAVSGSVGAKSGGGGREMGSAGRSEVLRGIEGGEKFDMVVEGNMFPYRLYHMSI